MAVLPGVGLAMMNGNHMFHVQPDGTVTETSFLAYEEPAQDMSMMKHTLGTLTGDAFDKAFIESMVPHHMQAIHMSVMPLAYAEHEELQTFGEKIIRDQAEEIRTMRSMYREWYAKDLQGMGNMMDMHGMMGGMMSGSHMAGMSSGGMDKMFLEMMIPHHEGALEMAELARTRAGHEELRDLAETIVSEQQREIDQMQEWLREWGYRE